MFVQAKPILRNRETEGESSNEDEDDQIKPSEFLKILRALSKTEEEEEIEEKNEEDIPDKVQTVKKIIN